MRTVKSYTYINKGEEREVDGIGRINAGEEITVPYTPLDDPLLELKQINEYDELEESDTINDDVSES